MKNLKLPTNSENLNCSESENLNYVSDFKKQFNKKIASLTKEQRIEFYCRLNKQAEILAQKYGLGTLKIGGDAE